MAGNSIVTPAEQNKSSGMETTLTLAETICASYTNIHSVSCLVRKTTQLEQNSTIMLSRVYYQRPDMLHVENITPIKRRILSDGKKFFLFQHGWNKGYSVPLDELTGEWKIMQQAVPATAMEHLLRLHGIPEEKLEPLPDLPLRRGYQTDKVFVTLACDEEGRLRQIEFFTNRDMQNRIAVYQYDNFRQITTDCWMAELLSAEITINNEILHETRRFDNLQVNQPVAAGMFDPQAFFKDVDFVDDFSLLETK